MNNNIELKCNELKLSYQLSDFTFTTTEELLGSNGIIGQESALNALESALKINAKGYNIYLCGESGVGKLSSIMSLLKRQRAKINTPQDITYVYNFINSEAPRLILLKPGDGKKFKQDMDEFIQFILCELPTRLQSAEANKRRQSLLDELEEEKENLLMELNEKAEEVGILVKSTKDGIGFAPLGPSGDIITKEEYSNLSKKQKEVLENNLSKLYTIADGVIEKTTAKEKLTLQELDDLNKEIFLNEVAWIFKRLKEKYRSYCDIANYLDEVYEDMIEHLGAFESNQEDSKEMKQIFSLLGASEPQKLVKKYRINLLVDHTETQGAPIITDIDLESYSLNGKILLDSEMNTLHSDFTNIRAGLLHKANGGYLILRVQSILENTGKWQALKKTLNTGYIHIENSEDINIATASSIKPEALKADVKIILIGDYTFYQALYNFDDDFQKLFKMRVNFEDQIDNSTEHINEFAQLVSSLCNRELMPHVNLKGFVKILEYGNRITQNPKKLPANMGTLLDLVREASIFSTDIIDEQSIEQAIKQRQNFKCKIEERVDEKIKEKMYLIDTEGEKVGEINGLTVCTIDDCMFGRPVKITATTYKGKLGIIDIEKEAGLGGDIHTKGIHIITGFLGQQFAQNMPLSLNCNICLEQSYSGIDGDSASSAELYAILSSLSNIPIKQYIAITGSVNQYGQIQPIGGVNEKIEGFFKVCKERTLKGNEGVVIPIQNKKELMLNDEIIEAVKMNLFHIYPVATIKGGIEIITGVNYGEIAKRVQQKLISFNQPQPKRLR